VRLSLAERDEENFARRAEAEKDRKFIAPELPQKEKERNFIAPEGA